MLIDCQLNLVVDSLCVCVCVRACMCVCWEMNGKLEEERAVLFFSRACIELLSMCVKNYYLWWFGYIMGKCDIHIK